MTIKRLKAVVYLLNFLNMALFLTTVVCIPKIFKVSILFSVASIIIMYLFFNDRNIIKIFILYIITLIFEFSLIEMVPKISICIVVAMIVFPMVCGYYIFKA